ETGLFFFRLRGVVVVAGNFVAHVQSYPIAKRVNRASSFAMRLQGQGSKPVCWQPEFDRLPAGDK
ncbi:MAG: hypothetical protein ACPHM2_08400, partial [Alcanivorax sp.]